MLKPLLTFAFAILFTLPACAAEPPPPLHPAVQMYIDEARTMCESAFGTFTFDRENYLKTADLNGDGRVDYVLSDGGFSCSGAASLYGGSGGTTHTTILSVPGGDGSLYAADPALILAYEFTIDDTKNPPQLVFHTRCNADGSDGTNTGKIRWHWQGGKMTRVHKREGCDE